MVEERNRPCKERGHNILRQPRNLPRGLHSLSGELFRKTFHLLSYFYAVVLYLLSDPVIMWGSALYIALLDYSRMLFPQYARLYDLLEGLTGRFMKDRERREISDATRMAVGVALSLTLFGKYALVGLAVSVPGDALASLVGKTLGGPKMVNDKRLSGFAAVVLWSSVVGFVLGYPVDLLLVGMAVGIVEMLSVRWENLVLSLWASFLSFLLLGNAF